ncbi:hypothetical protein J1N35_008596 [Gossypium stocksii]|uniref:Uncharacterized protein n=1 Tax=Gossypium stocksii TaxID=47602 RepID=A0A9D3WAL7_9ROSI|nr:hypothetical protein J1N35_008596 [Gossypium stocksii]
MANHLGNLILRAARLYSLTFIDRSMGFLMQVALYVATKMASIKKTVFLCSINRRVCSCSNAVDRLRNSLHALLAPFHPLGLGLFTARECG